MGVFKEWLSNFEDWFLALEGYGQDHYKVVFMAGGPGSGKTYVAKAMFQDKGFKFANSDEILESFISKRYKIDLAAPKGSPEYEKYMQGHSRASDLSVKRTDIWRSNGLPIVVDITGRDVNLVKRLKYEFEKSGYECYMVFVDTSLETAIERNKNRPRTVDEDFLTNAWRESQKNKTDFQSIFGNNFKIVSNDKVEGEYRTWKGFKLPQEQAYKIELSNRAKKLITQPELVRQRA